MSKEILKAIPVQFNGDTIYAVTVNQRPYVVVKSICDAIGLHSDRALSTLKEHHILSKHLLTERVQLPIFAKNTLPEHAQKDVQVGQKGADLEPEHAQSRKMTLLSLEKLDCWLIIIDIHRVAEHVRPILERFQNECFNILDSYFRGPINTILKHHSRTNELKLELKTLNARITEIKKELTEMSNFAEEYYSNQQTSLIFDI